MSNNLRHSTEGQKLWPVWMVVVAKTLSDVGFALSYICANSFIWQKTSSAFATGALIAMLYGGGIVGGHIAHRFGNHWNRRKAMMHADIWRGIAILVLVALPGNLQLYAIYPIIFTVGIGRSIFESTFAASLPECAGSRLQLINSVLSAFKGMALVAGMALAAVAIQRIGFRPLFAVDGISYLISFVAILILPLQLQRLEVVASKVESKKTPTLLRLFPFFAGPFAATLIIRGLDAFGSGSHHVGLPILSTLRDAANPSQFYGTIWALWACGMPLSGFVLRPLFKNHLHKSPESVFFVCTACMSIGFISIFLAKSFVGIVVACLIAGCGDGLSEIAFRQTLQQAPDHQRGKLFGFAEIIMNTGLICGILFAGLVMSQQNVALWVLGLHGIPVVVAIVLSVVMKPDHEKNVPISEEGCA